MDRFIIELVLQYPHRALVAPRVRATVDFLLERFASIEALRVTPADIAHRTPK